MVLTHPDDLMHISNSSGWLKVGHGKWIEVLVHISATRVCIKLKLGKSKDEYNKSNQQWDDYENVIF